MSWFGWRLVKTNFLERPGLQSTMPAGMRWPGNLGHQLLELAALASKGRIHLNISLESFLQEVESRFVVLPMSGKVCARAMGLPETYPKDPADRIIGATALVEGLLLLTADRQIRRSRVVRTAW